MDKLKIQTADMVERNIKMLGLMFYFLFIFARRKKRITHIKNMRKTTWPHLTTFFR